MAHINIRDLQMLSAETRGALYRVRVIACFHSSRDPRQWQRRS
jgi:hypothetical protein